MVAAESRTRGQPHVEPNALCIAGHAWAAARFADGSIGQESAQLSTVSARPFEVAKVTGAGNSRNLGPLDTIGESVSVGRRDQLVLLGHDDQGRMI